MISKYIICKDYSYDYFNYFGQKKVCIQIVMTVTFSQTLQFSIQHSTLRLLHALIYCCCAIRFAFQTSFKKEK